MAKKCKCQKGQPFRQCHTRGDFEDEIRAHGGETFDGTNHVRVKGPRGFTAMPRHGRNEDYADGTRRSIIRQLIQIGLGVIIMVSLFIIIF